MFQMLSRLILTAAAAALMQSSCVTVVNPPSGDDPTPTTIKIRLVNLSADALDPQLYVSAQALGDPETTLFLAENLVTQGIGFAGTGLIPAGQLSEVEIACDKANGVGTRGGVFKDATNGNVLGNATQRVLGSANGYSCGNTITFTFRAISGGFTNSYSVE